MKEGFRQSMSWLHTWCGLTCGWLLCAIFLTGTLSVFREPITRWMEAKPVLAAPAQSTLGDAPRSLARATAYLSEQAPNARFWRIVMPLGPDDAMQLAWRAGATTEHRTVHPLTGVIQTEPWGRKTEGGRHFVLFHYMLHVPTIGYWIVGWISMCMLVALISGVVVHRRIFVDFFTFRPGKGQRSWMDAHNVSAVLPLPFLFMIVYTGLAIFYTGYMPWPLQTAYGTDPSAYRQFQTELTHDVDPARSRPPPATATRLQDVASLQREAEALTRQPTRMIIVEQPGQAGATVRVIGRIDPATPSGGVLSPVASVLFDGATGTVLKMQRPDVDAPFAAEDIHAAMESLHFARFGGWGMRWLYFFCGLLGTLMIATGAILFTSKRRKKSANEFGHATSVVYRTIESLNIAAIAGIVVACIAYFYVNRLLSVTMIDRSAWEIRGSMLVWLATSLYALWRKPQRAWVELLGLAALLCLALPLLNLITTGQHLGQYIKMMDLQRAGVELVSLGLGAALAWAAWRIRSASRNIPQVRRAAGRSGQGSMP
ncbi:PepSY-associated TM helix domain-containing protein [Alcaligenaceae bacterium C4P045]|nr:PepSY-associated TM helix domain-containing protein [Alcaligenaceae bacterium C4P045]